TCWWRTISNFMEVRPISTMSLARTAGMKACCTIRAYQATISTRVFPASRYSMTITIKAYKHIQDGNQLQGTGNAGCPLLANGVCGDTEHSPDGRAHRGSEQVPDKQECQSAIRLV